MNHLTIAGRLGKDMELRRTNNGEAVGSFTVADDQGKDRPTIWWRCQIWGKRAESLAPYLTKGASVTISGQVTEREWTDQQGQQRKAQEVRVIDLALQGGRESAPTSAPRQNPDRAQQYAQRQTSHDFADADIPF